MGIRPLRQNFVKRKCTGALRTNSLRSETGEGALRESVIRPTETFFPYMGVELFQH